LVHDQKYPKCGFGVLEKQRKFDIDAPAPIPEWANDKRKSTTSDLLHMNSGLQWVEDYFLMLQNAFQADMTRALEYKPNMKWNYSSGTTNLLSVFCKTVQNTSRIFRFLVHRFDR
jgi:CubicO group peptidase (beta-lactamase class C family)